MHGLLPKGDIKHHDRFVNDRSPAVRHIVAVRSTNVQHLHKLIDDQDITVKDAAENRLKQLNISLSGSKVALPQHWPEYDK